MSKINTVVDGIDVIKVNLWEHPGNEDKGALVASLLKDTEVSLIGQCDDYVHVHLTDDEGVTLHGWCLKDFVHDTDS